MDYANRFDRELAGVFESREKDWRNGAVIYQVLVDRFVPSANLDAKRHLYPSPKTLRNWSETPAKGQYLESHKLWSHEIDFWGGDLASTASQLDHILYQQCASSTKRRRNFSKFNKHSPFFVGT